MPYSLNGVYPNPEGDDDLQVLSEDSDRRFCRAWHLDTNGDPRSVLVVLPAAEHPAPTILDRLAHEYSLRDELDAAWAARPSELLHEDGRSMLVLEDPGGEPLERLLSGPIEVGRFLRIAIGISSALSGVHRRDLIHKDIKPANILVNCVDGQVRLTGFGITSLLPRERQLPDPPETIAGTLAYMAPEQTGRMNRSIDSRSDLYALGVTLYEMLTGGLPFAAGDSTEWVHCHIARQPVAPGERTQNVPAPVSAIVMKLLSKTAEDRYQTAAGLEWDLRRCLADWEVAARIDAFPLGTHDRAQQLVIPEKLYGRDSEINTLLHAFERVVAEATPELVLVSGYSGIGKSSVVNELHKVIVLPRGIFIAGKFDLRLNETPYSTLAQAFQGLIRQILNGQEADADRWRDAIKKAVGKQGRLLTDLIPELAMLIGPQPPVPMLSPLETRLRFQSAFRNFVGVFARAEHPLVIFIDDLQWLDPASLTVLESLITHPDTRHLLLIGAYRNNEVSEDHPLMGTLGAIRKSGARVHEIVLDPLSVDDLTELLCDALRCGRADVLPLGALVHRKTGGNPFFATQFLTHLVEEGFAGFEPNSNCWRWDLPRIEAMGFTENVIDLMVRRLQRLSPAAQDALKLLACLGSQADLGTLAKIWEGSEAEVHSDFADAIRAGAILSIGRSLKFVHDRVQEAAYALIPSESRPECHLRIGRLLLSTMSQQETTDRIFDVVTQWNFGSQLISDSDDRQRIAALNLQAAKKAKASTAYASACRYLSVAIVALGQQGWRDCYKLTFSVWFERAECEFLSSNFGEAVQWIEELLPQAKSKVERAQAYRLRMVLQLVEGDNARAIRTAVECLLMFDIELPESPTNDQVQAEYDAVWSNLGAHPIESLLTLPMMENPEMREVMNVYYILCLSAYFTDTNLCQTIACRMVSVTQKHGTTDSAIMGYGCLSIFLGPVFQRYHDGEKFAQLAVQVAEEHGFVAQKVGANFLMQMAVLWTRPIEIALRCLDDAFSSAQEAGEIVWACYSQEHRVTDLMARGDSLDQVWLESVKALDFVRRYKFRHVSDIIESVQSFVRSLREQVSDSAGVEEAALEARLVGSGIAVVVCFYWILQIQRYFLLGAPEKALECAEKAKPLLWSARCHIQFTHYCLYHSVALAAVYGTASYEKQAEIRSELAANIQALERWAQSCPATFGHKHVLVCGELARLEGRAMEAIRLYERAARAAGEYGFVQDQGLANELAARCCLASGAERAAHAYLREARDCYFRWGALGKVAQMDQRYPASKPSASPVSRATIEEFTERLDLATIAKTAQAISSEMVVEDLIKSLMVIAVEHAGAERALLIFPRETDEKIEAEARIQRDTVIVRFPEQSLAPPALPRSIIRHVVRTRENVVLDDASTESPFSSDPYIRQKRVRSVLCLPLLKQAKLVGVLYLENNLAPRVFVPARAAVLKLLASQAAISLENTRLYRDVAEREAKIRRLVDANIIGIFIWDLEGQILDANDAFLRLVGYDREDLLSNRIRWTDLTPPEWRERNAQTVADLTMTGIAQPYEKEYFRKDGSRVPVLIAGTAFDEKRNQGVGFVLDLTERKRAEELLHDAQTQLAHANRVATMGQLAASIAHEVSQPIAATRNNASAALNFLETTTPDLDEVREALRCIVNDADRAGDIVGRIRDQIKKAPRPKDRFDINDALREVIASVRGELIKNSVSLQTRFDHDLPPILADRVQLQQVILNLILNAIEAMSSINEGVRELFICTEPIQEGGTLVSVRDSGPGIDPEDLGRVFDSFFTTKSGGMGMGLSICRSIIEAHGGQLWASGNVPRGAVFRFILPADSDSALDR